MINDKDIVFVTTTLNTKWLNYQGKIINQLFPDSKHLVINGSGNWPNSWFYWIDEIKKCDEKFYIHIDEDFFITSKPELMKVLQHMESNNIDLVGIPDGYNHFRGSNPVAINTFLMFGRTEHLRKINIDLKSLKYNMGYDGKKYFWMNSANIKFKPEYKNDFNYQHKIQGDGDFIHEQEPYYAFMWTMKSLGCKFDYLYPHFDERFKSTNPRINEESLDIGIHMWYTRSWFTNEDVWGLPNIKRYQLVEEFLNQL